MAASDEHSPDEPFLPLPSWQLFANIATMSELLDEVAQVQGDSVAESAFVDPLAVESLAADTVASLYSGIPRSQPVAPDRVFPEVGIAIPKGQSPAASSAARPVAAPLVDLGRPSRRSIFVPPLMTLADVEPGVEPDVRKIAAVGSHYQPGSLARAVGASSR